MSEDLKTKVLIGAVAVALSAPMVATASGAKEKCYGVSRAAKMIALQAQALPAQALQPWITKAMPGRWWMQAAVWKSSCQMMQAIKPVWDPLQP